MASLYSEWVSERWCACEYGRACPKDADAVSDVSVTKVVHHSSDLFFKGKNIVIVIPCPLPVPPLGLRWGFLFVVSLISPILYYPYLYCIVVLLSPAHPRPCLRLLKVCSLQCCLCVKLWEP